MALPYVWWRVCVACPPTQSSISSTPSSPPPPRLSKLSPIVNSLPSPSPPHSSPSSPSSPLPPTLLVRPIWRSGENTSSIGWLSPESNYIATYANDISLVVASSLATSTALVDLLDFSFSGISSFTSFTPEAKIELCSLALHQICLSLVELGLLQDSLSSTAPNSASLSTNNVTNRAVAIPFSSSFSFLTSTSSTSSPPPSACLFLHPIPAGVIHASWLNDATAIVAASPQI